MKTRYLGLVVLMIAGFLLAGTLIPNVLTQPTTPKYFLVDYMKVDPGDESEYLKLEEDVWKPLHQELIKNGILKSWSVYGVEFPSGTDEKYNFLTINVFNSLQDYEKRSSSFGSVFPKVHPNKKVDDVLSQTFKTRRLVRSELWVLIDQTE